MTTSSRIHVTTGVGEPLNTVSNRAGDPSITLRLFSGVSDGGDAPAVAAAAPEPDSQHPVSQSLPLYFTVRL